MIKEGARVSVYPHGQQDLATVGVVTDAWNRRVSTALKTFIRVQFDQVPPFAPQGAKQIFLLNFGIGPWVELGGGGHYEVEVVEDVRRGRTLRQIAMGKIQEEAINRQ